MSDVVVSVENVSKKYCRSLKRGMLYTTVDVLRDTVGLRGPNERLRPDEFWATREVSFELKRGECLGLIGLNGAGKSTLLKLLNGIIRPDIGQIRMKGRVGALIEVGAGFHPMLTGRENIYVNGAILGMGKKEIDRKIDSIIDFSGLESSVLDAPVKTYSSGMYVRLGFAVAVHTEPDILLVDEVLAVGDIRFIGRCRQKIQELRDQGTSIILVSHSLSLIEDNCDLGMLMAKGQKVMFGTSRAATAAYRRRLLETEVSKESRSGDPGASFRFISGSLVTPEGKDATSLHCGDTGTLRLTISTKEPVTAGHICVWIVDENAGQVAGVGYIDVSRDLKTVESGDLFLQFPCQVVPGDYRLGATFSTDGQFSLVDEFTACGFTVDPLPNNPFKPSGTFVFDVNRARGSDISVPLCLNGRQKETSALSL